MSERVLSVGVRERPASRVALGAARLACAAVMVAALLLRLWSVLTHTYVIFLDETFQYLEPAHRVAFGAGVVAWRNHGMLHGYPVNDRDDWLYEDPGPNPPRKAQGVKLENRRRLMENVVCGSQEVQYEA